MQSSTAQPDLAPSIPVLALARGLQTLQVSYRKGNQQYHCLIDRPDTLALITYESINPDLREVYLSARKWVCYENTCVLLDADRWPVFRPTMDTLYLMDNLSRMEIFHRAESLVAIGTGCGLDFKYCLKNMPNLRQAYGTDINPAAVQATRFNIQDIIFSGRNSPEDNSIVVTTDPDARALCTLSDLIISNPAYLPSPRYTLCAPDSFESGFAGTAMLKYVLHYAAGALARDGRLVMVFSDLAHREYEQETIRSGLVEVSRFSQEVSFKIDLVVNDPEWVEYLVRERGLKSHSVRPGTNYRHTIHVVALARPR